MGRGPRRPYSAAYSGCHFFLARKRGTGLFLNSRGAGGGRGEASPPDSGSTQPAPGSLITEFRLRPESSTRCAKCPLSRRLSSLLSPVPAPRGAVWPHSRFLLWQDGGEHSGGVPWQPPSEARKHPQTEWTCPRPWKAFCRRRRCSVAVGRSRSVSGVLPGSFPAWCAPRSPRRCSASLRTPAGPPFSAHRLPAAAPSPPGARAHRAGQAPCPGGQTRRLRDPARRWAGPRLQGGSAPLPPAPRGPGSRLVAHGAFPRCACLWPSRRDAGRWIRAHILQGGPVFTRQRLRT